MALLMLPASASALSYSSTKSAALCSSRWLCSSTSRLCSGTAAKPNTRMRWRRGRIRSAVAPTASLEAMETVEDSSLTHNDPVRVVVVGGGPAGCLMARYLLRRGFNVELFEKYNAPKMGQNNEQFYFGGDFRSFPMILSTRGIKALEGADLKVPSTIVQKLAGGVRNLNNGKQIKYDSFCEPGFEGYGVSRNALVAYILNSLHDRYPGKLSIHFNWELVSISDCGSSATFQRIHDHKGSSDSAITVDRQPEPLEVRFDLIIGADGVNSVVRKELLRIDKLYFDSKSGGSPLSVELTETSEGYKAFHISREIVEKSPLFEDRDRIQSWQALGLRLIGMADGSFWGVSITNDLIYATTGEEVESALRQGAPEVLELVLQENPNFCEDFSKQPVLHPGAAVILSQFHRDKILVIGDAAHAMFPVYGTGCNAALEDCAILDRILENYCNTQSDMKKALELTAAEFTRTRLLDAHTIVKLNITKELFPSSPISFMQSSFFKALHKWFPKIFPVQAGQQLTGMKPFSEIKQQKKVENIAFATVLVVFAVVLGTAAFVGLRIVGLKVVPRLLRQSPVLK